MHSVVVWGFGCVVAVGHQNVRQEMGVGDREAFIKEIECP